MKCTEFTAHKELTIYYGDEIVMIAIVESL